MKPNLLSFSRKLRKKSTETEAHLWYNLRAKRFDGLKFRRQVAIGRYIVDFVCFDKKVIIECDGNQHLIQQEKDKNRDKWFTNQGYKVLRFWDNDVLKNTDEILEAIYQACFSSKESAPSPQPSPIQGGGGKTNK